MSEIRRVGKVEIQPKGEKREGLRDREIERERERERER